MQIDKILDSKMGANLISIILGLGLAALFRRVCNGNNCIVLKGPNVEDVKKYYYKIDNDCFSYKPVATACNDNPIET